MNIFLYFLALQIYVAFSQEKKSFSFYTEQEFALLDVCSQELGTSINRTEFTLTGTISNEANHVTRCLFFCVPQKLSLTDGNGTLDSAQVRSIILTRYPSLAEKENLVRIVVKKCIKRNFNDACDRWYYLTKCIWNTYLNNINRSQLRQRMANRFELKRNEAHHLRNALKSVNSKNN